MNSHIRKEILNPCADIVVRSGIQLSVEHDESITGIEWTEIREDVERKNLGSLNKILLLKHTRVGAHRFRKEVRDILARICEECEIDSHGYLIGTVETGNSVIRIDNYDLRKADIENVIARSVCWTDREGTIRWVANREKVLLLMQRILSIGHPHLPDN
jgi:hypothetical protein